MIFFQIFKLTDTDFLSRTIKVARCELAIIFCLVVVSQMLLGTFILVPNVDQKFYIHGGPLGKKIYSPRDHEKFLVGGR